MSQEFGNKMLEALCQCLADGKTVTFKVNGRSMRPMLEHQRDTVHLKAADTYRKGDVVMVRMPGGIYVLHRVERVSEGRVTLRGDGNVGITETCLMSDIKARLVAFDRKGKRWDTASAKWRAYSVLWQSLRPVRRLILGFLSVTNRLTHIYESYPPGQDVGRIGPA